MKWKEQIFKSDKESIKITIKTLPLKTQYVILVLGFIVLYFSLYFLLPFLLLFVIAILIYSICYFMHKKDKLPVAWSWVIFFILIFSTIYSFYYGQTGYSDNNVIYTTYPVKLNVHIEDLLNNSYCLSVINASNQVINSISNVSISINSVNNFENDGITKYDNSSLGDIVPSGNFATSRYNANKNGIAYVELYCIYGESDDFVGKANPGGPWVAIMFEEIKEYDFWQDVHVTLHELGHIFGSEHYDSEDYIMYKTVNTSYVPDIKRYYFENINEFADYSDVVDEFNYTLGNNTALFSYWEYSDYANFEDNISSETFDYVVFLYNKDNNSLDEYNLNIIRGISYNEDRGFAQVSMSKRSVSFEFYNSHWGLGVEV